MTRDLPSTSTIPSNPLLDFTGLPRFDEISRDHVAPAVDELLAGARAAVARVTEPEFAADWDAVVEALDVASERFSRAWGAVAHINAVADTPELREQYNEDMPTRDGLLDARSRRRALYSRYKALSTAADCSGLPRAARSSERDAQFRAGRRGAAAGQERALQAGPEREAQVSTRFARTCSMRPTPSHCTSKMRVS